MMSHFPLQSLATPFSKLKYATKHGGAGPKEERSQAVINSALHDHGGCAGCRRQAASRKVQLWTAKTRVATSKSPEVWPYACRPSYPSLHREEGAERRKQCCDHVQDLGGPSFWGSCNCDSSFPRSDDPLGAVRKISAETFPR